MQKPVFCKGCGSLMYITLQRARTAREAVIIMGQLVEKHGYVSVGESFSVADPKEVWFMDRIGKGPEEIYEYNVKTRPDLHFFQES